MAEGALIAYLIPTIWEVYNDRNGESKRGKVIDAVIVVIMWSALSYAFLLLFSVPVVSSVVLMAGIRVMLFDYAVQYVLIKRHIIKGHWFTYTGKTAMWDKMIAKIKPWLRFAIRVALFAGSVVFWIYF